VITLNKKLQSISANCAQTVYRLEHTSKIRPHYNFKKTTQLVVFNSHLRCSSASFEPAATRDSSPKCTAVGAPDVTVGYKSLFSNE